MTTYSEFIQQIEQEKDEIVCECKISETFKPKTLYVVPSGGFSAVLYTLGTMKALFESGVLMTSDNEFNRDNMFIGSSGGALVLFQVLTAIHLKLHKKEPKNWFKLYVEDTFNKITPYTIVRLYAFCQLRSLISEKLTDCFLHDWSYQQIDDIINNLASDELKGQPGIDFLNDELAYYFRFNYIKVVNSNMPYMTDNNKDLLGMTIIEQFKTIFCSSATINGLTYARFFQNHDAGGILNNYINCLSSYIDNSHIRNILYFTTIAYDKFSYKQISSTFSITNFNNRYIIESNYFFIQTLQEKCKAAGKNFCLINPPNKFNPIRKFDVGLYNYLQQRIYYESDFMDMSERFIGTFFFHNGSDMRKIVTLFGYYETIYILKEINAFNRQKQKQFVNINYDYIKQINYNIDDGSLTIGNKAGNLFKLSPEQIKLVVIKLKYNMIKECFFSYCGCKDKSSLLLEEYLTMMQNKSADDYIDLFPVFKMNKKILKNPERILDKKYKRVSKNSVNIYFPSFTEKLKNIIPFR
jgi:hypothetical protein